jgi:hypothetical protein
MAEDNVADVDTNTDCKSPVRCFLCPSFARFTIKSTASAAVCANAFLREEPPALNEDLFQLTISLKLTMESIGSTSSNRALNISLVTTGAQGLETLHSFNPEMTYSIFGETETIFGYQGLKINLRYHASDMRPSLQITYNRKFKTVGETSPTDLKAILEPVLPKSKHVPAIYKNTS